MNDAIVLMKPQTVKKPRRGDCGTCHWFEREEMSPQPGMPWSGVCLLNPPVSNLGMVAAGLGPQGPMMRQQLQGICPPTHELRRCQWWRAFGRVPDSTEKETSR